MRRFRVLRNVRRPAREQGLIHYTCLNYDRQTASVRRKIDKLCETAGGEYAPALKAFLTTEANWIWVCQNYHVSESTLERIRRRFFELW